MWRRNCVSSILVAAAATLLTGCEKAATQVMPVAEVMKTEVESNIFSPDEVHLTIRNIGVSGRFIITISQKAENGYKEWHETAYFDAKEERKVSIEVKGLESGEYRVSVKAE